MAENYEISLGIGLDDSDFSNIKTKIKSLEDDPVKIKLDTKDADNKIDNLKKQLQDLNKANGNKPSLDINTVSLEKSLDRVATAIDEIKKSLNTVDGKSSMQSLLSSINQITTALGKAENETDSLVKSLSALSKKDFSLNIGIDMGKSNNNMVAYGRAARKQVIPELESQIKYLENLFGGQQATMNKLVKHGKDIGFDVFTDFGDFNADSAIKRMEAMEKYINSMKKLATIDNVKLDGFNEIHKDASELINDITGVENAIDKAGDIPQKLKNLFGGSVDGESLSKQLDSIVVDLGEIRTAIQGLSSGTSIDGLTASFNRLSDVLDKLDANFDKIKNSLGNELAKSVSADNAVKAAQHTGQQIGEAISKSAKQAINLDDVIDKEVSSIMQKYSIVGDKGSSAFDEIKQAVIECRNELGILENGNFSIDEQVFGSSRAIDKVTDAIANQMRAVNNLGDGYVKLANYITDYNTKGYKVRIPSNIKQDQGDDYKSNKSTLGIAFTTGKGNDFADFVTQLNQDLGQTIDLTKGETAAFEELLHKVELGRQQRDALKKSDKYLTSTASTDEILSQNYINKNEIYDDAMSAVDVINKAEQQIAQTSTQSANTVVQNEERKQQAYRETSQFFDKISRDTSLVRDNASFKQTFEATNQAAQEAQKHFQSLLADEKAVVSVTEQFDGGNALQSFVVNVKRASGEVETLRYAMDKLDDGSNNGFTYQGASSNDRSVEKQLDKYIKKANDLQIQLDKIKSGYSDLGTSKPIKEESHIKSLSDQYDKVQAAIENVKNADNATYTSMVSNAEKEKAALESLVQIYKNAETFSTDLRAKDRDTAKEVYSSRLDILSSKMRKDGVYTGLESDVSALGTKISSASDVKTLSEIANELTKLDAKYKSAKAAKDEFNNSQNVGSSVSSLKSEIEILQKASPSIKSFKTEINGAEVSIESLLKDLSQVDTKGDFNVVKNRVEAFGKAAEAAGIDLNEAKAEVKKVNDAYKQMLEIQKQIRSLSIKEKNLTELGNTSELNEVSSKLKDLKSDYETLKRTFSDKLTSTQFGNLQAEIDETESELKQLDAKFADTKAKLASNIKLNMELGTYDNQLSSMYDKLDRLSGASKELRDGIEQVENAYREMNNALKGTGDEVADRERLVQAEKDYAAALEKTNNLIKIQSRAESKDARKDKLENDIKLFQADIDRWLVNNSAATKKFGSQMLDLRAKAEGVDRVTLNGLIGQFKLLDKQADKAGLKMMSVTDKIKSKAKEYMAYFSVAEIFMEVTQAMKNMFDTVVEIDTAMTGLYRVTDLTSAQYDTLFDNMISSAKEYGATLNDIINATTDWVRAGFDADTALGLAEVTTMYQHISDLDYDTAAENLITAYNGFKDELNGAFDGDQVAAVNYIADIFNELDNNFAVTSAGLGEALTRSASALDLAGNSIQETAG